ncbi:MAG TPA: nitronate monooxygenase [Chloroflexota bacterium]|nr:nitronate monooxygenase [Chloroflexota bacterium]
MLHTRICELLGVRHPVVLGGMGGGATNPELVAAVTNAGGFGIMSVTHQGPDQQRADVQRLRQLTGDKPFGLNHLLFMVEEARFEATLELRPKVVSTAWPWPEQDLRRFASAAHAAGALFMHMVSTTPEAVRAAEAGADVVVAQGSEGGGHVGWMGTLPLVPMVVRAVAPVPVLAAGGLADGAGLAAVLALGAEGVLLGTRFLATPEAPVANSYKRAIVEHDGHDTFLTEIPDIAQSRVWPGAMSRVARNRFIERWAGREWEVRQRRAEINQAAIEARARDDGEEYHLSMGQTAGLIHDIAPAAQIVARIAAEAEDIIAGRLRALVG